MREKQRVFRKKSSIYNSLVKKKKRPGENLWLLLVKIKKKELANQPFIFFSMQGNGRIWPFFCFDDYDDDANLVLAEIIKKNKTKFNCIHTNLEKIIEETLRL